MSDIFDGQGQPPAGAENAGWRHAAAVGITDPHGFIWESAPRTPPSLREARVDALGEHMAAHQGKLSTEYSQGMFTVTYGWASDEWRGQRDPDGRATVKARSADLTDTLMCVVAQAEQGIEFHPLDAGLADLKDAAVYAGATEYYAGPFCSCGDYSCPRSADENARCVNTEDLAADLADRPDIEEAQRDYGMSL